MKLLALLLVCACGPAVAVRPMPSDVACETDQGLLIMRPVPVGWCDEVQGVEDRIHEAFRTLGDFDPRFKSSIERTRGYKVFVSAEAIWDTPTGPAIGQTFCDTRTIRLNNNRPASNTLGHELAHAVQGCEPTQPWDLSGGVQTYYHSNWAPIYAALKKQNLRP